MQETNFRIPGMEIPAKVRFKNLMVKLVDLPGSIGPVPTPEMVQSVATFGVVLPVVLGADDEGNFVICDGIRRVLAARANNLGEIPARVIETTDKKLLAALTFMLNAYRADNPLAEGKALEILISSWDGQDAHTMAELGQQLGIDVRRIRSTVMVMRSLTARAKTVVRQGGLAHHLIRRFSKLTAKAQDRLILENELNADAIAKHEPKKDTDKAAIRSLKRACATIARTLGDKEALWAKTLGEGLAGDCRDTAQRVMEQLGGTK